MKTILILALTYLLTSCSSSKTKSVEPAEINTDTDYSLQLNGDSDSKRAGALQTIHFAYRSSELTKEVKKILDENIVFFTAHPGVEAQIEGHTDERGSAQFNLTLGEKRAKAVRDYMVVKGINDSRLSVISYGKERPIGFLHGEESWSQNRRANFLITKK